MLKSPPETAPVPELTMTKGDFARLIGVSAGRVSQLIASGTIGPEALDGVGRGARIRPDIARRQIADRRHPGQALGNGSATRLDIVSLSEAPGGPFITDGSLDQRYKQERLLRAQLENRRLFAAEQDRGGRFTLAADVRTQLSRLEAKMLESFRDMLPLFASAVACKFAVPEAAVLDMLNAGLREASDRRNARKHPPPEGCA